MNKFLLYINQILESLDIPTLSDSSSKKFKTSIKNNSKSIHLEDK